MKPTIEIMLPYRKVLTPAYVDYVKDVSDSSWAISIETASYARWLCDLLDADLALDLGSGFTSFALRHSAADVTSVDDDPAWLAKTGDFLRKYSTVTGALVTWNDWSVLNATDSYDVIVHDFAIGEARESAMWNAAQALAPGGALIFDDAQHEGHLAEMHRVALHYGLTLHSLHDLTLDSIGRFAMVASSNPLVEGDGS